MDTDAGRKGSPVILAEKPMPILFMERAQPSTSICDRDNSRCPANFFFFWHRLLSGGKIAAPSGKQPFSHVVKTEKDQYTASDPGTDADGKQG